MTGRDLVAASMRLIGAIAPGESPSAGEATDGLASLNRMLDTWSTESLMIYARVREQFTLSGAASYTMGTGGTLNTSRPVEIDEINILITSGSQSIEYPVRLVSLDQWANIAIKGVVTGIPTDAYIEGSYPLETINLFPVPNSAASIVIWSQKPLTRIATLDTVISLPPGYEEALIYNFAVRISPEYGRPVTAEVADTARESKASLKRKNHSPSYLGMDSGLLGPRVYNIMTGDYR